MGIGTQIKALRKQAGLTQPELAERVGVHETSIRRWEKEKDSGPDIVMIMKLADALGVKPESLLSKSTAKVLEAKEEDSLVYEWGGTNRLKLPNTPETRTLFERLVLAAMSNRSAAMA